MPRKSFAYNLENSKVSLLASNDAKSKIIPKAMAQVAFHNVFFEFDGEQNKPYMVFDGEIEAYSVMKNSDDDFFNKVKRVVFAPDNRPQGSWHYEFDDNQIAEIAAAEWFTHGSNTPPEFLSTRFALIVDNIQVDILNPDLKKDGVPILKVGPADNHVYKFGINDYELAPFIVDNVRLPQTEFETILDIESEEHRIEAQAALSERQRNAVREVTPLTEQQLRIRNAARSADLYAESVWEEINEYRVAHSSEYRREAESIRAKTQATPKTATVPKGAPAPKAAVAQPPKTGAPAQSNAAMTDFLEQFKGVSQDKAEKPAVSAAPAAPEAKPAKPTAANIWGNFAIGNTSSAKALNEETEQESKTDDSAQTAIHETPATEKLAATTSESEPVSVHGEAAEAQDEESVKRRRAKQQAALRKKTAIFAEQEAAQSEDAQENRYDNADSLQFQGAATPENKKKTGSQFGE
jgi:hypothetical protein